MSAYLISIAPAPDAAGVTDSDAFVSVLIETSGDTARIVEMTVRSSAPGGLSLQRLAQIDLALIGRTLAAGAGAGSGAVSSRAVSSSGPDTPDTPDTAARRPAGSRSAVAGASRARAASSKATASNAASSTAPTTRPAAASSRAARGSKQVRRTERAYRRMPAVGELLATFAEIGSVTKLAEHYGVPRHTAQGWMGRARKAEA